jgi:hypothetical protein
VVNGAGDEPLDLIDDQVKGREPERVVVARVLDEARPRDAIRQPLSSLDGHNAVAVDV